MASLDRRVRALGWLIGRRRIESLDADAIASAQARRIPHNAVTDLLFGAVSSEARSVDFVTDGPHGGVPVRVYRPRSQVGLLPLVINFHGGGWVFGDLNLADWLCSTIAARVRAVVLSVDYRLAPAHRFPAAVDDCYATLLWASENHQRIGADASRLAVMGDSAGGNLAAVMCQMVTERTGPTILHQSLIYPATDLTAASESMKTHAHAPFLTSAETLACRDHYLPDERARHDPRASPLLAADLSGLPPALIQVAEHDPIRDDGVRYAAALESAGVDVRLTEYAGMPHGFLSFPKLCRAAPRALGEICREQSLAFAVDTAAAVGWSNVAG